MRWIYLDYNTTTPIAPSVQEAMLPYLAERYANPSSSHVLGRVCQEAMEDARSQVAALLGADRDEIVFTSGGTEANNLALQGTLLKHAPGGTGHLVISALEHPSVVETAGFLERLGYDVSIVGCNRQGLIDPAVVAAAVRPQTRLVSVMHANHEIGVIQPLREIAAACHQRQVLLHTDAVQTVGKIPVNVDELEVDLLSIAGHKLHAPKGVGALFVRRGVALEPLLHGAGQEGGLRAGTENIPAIVGLGRACALAGKCLVEAAERLALLRDRLWSRLQASIGPELKLHGEFAPRLPSTLSVGFPRVSGNDLLARVPEIIASTSSGQTSPYTLSPTLAALGLTPGEARGVVRLSVGWYTSADDIDRAADLLIAAWDDLRL